MDTIPNETRFEGLIHKITPAGDGVGAEAEVIVSGEIRSGKSGNFVGAKSGELLQMFVAAPDEISTGRKYRMTAMRRGGPGGNRVVLKNAKLLRR